MTTCSPGSFWNTAAPEWAAAVGTFVLAFVAVFQEWLRERIRRPNLRLNKPYVGPPDAEKTIVKLLGVDLSGVQVAQPLEEAAVYYFRLGITNQGKSAARDVQVFLAGVRRQRADGAYAPVNRFTPLNLTWAHMNNNPTLPVLLPGMPPRLCDLGHITDPSSKFAFGEDLPEVGPAVPVLALNLEVKPNSLGHLLGPGTYLFNLILVASNCPPRPYTVNIVFRGEWFDNPQQMFNDGVGMNLVSGA